MRRIDVLDYGRFVAAVFVLLFHYGLSGIATGKVIAITETGWLASISQYGYLGVEFFFMISGFVIFFSAKGRSASQFAASRLTRLYPAFWVAMLTTSAFAYFWGGDMLGVTLQQVLVNLSMIAKPLGQPYVDGAYWTLWYEIQFYAAVFLFLLLGLQKHLDKLALLWPPALLFAWATQRDWLPLLNGYYAYFAAGALFALLKDQRSVLAAVELAALLGLCVTFSAGNASSLTENHGVYYSPVVIGAAITAFFLLFAAVATTSWDRVSLPCASLLGALTYPLYLLHTHIGYMVINRFANEGNVGWVIAGTAALVLLLAYAIHVLIELRLRWLWERLFGKVVAAADATRLFQKARTPIMMDQKLTASPAQQRVHPHAE